MSKRKIASCINVRINVGNFQHIELVKYAEEEIEYSSAEERIAKEDDLRNDLVSDIIRSMKAIPERLGKGISEAIEVEESIKKAIPSWLEENPIPNIANNAEKLVTKVAAEQKDALSKQNKIIPEEIVKDDKISAPQKDTAKPNEPKDNAKENVKDLFEDDLKALDANAATDDDDIFDDDLFN